MEYPDADERYDCGLDSEQVHSLRSPFGARWRADIFTDSILLSRRHGAPMLSAHRRAMPGAYGRAGTKKAAGRSRGLFVFFISVPLFERRAHFSYHFGGVRLAEYRVARDGCVAARLADCGGVQQVHAPVYLDEVSEA